MTRWLISFILQELVLPLSLLVAIAMRQSATSGLYLLLLFASPLIPVPTSKTMGGSSGIYQKVVLAAATLNMIAMMAFQIVLACYPPYGHIVHTFCSEVESILRYAGFIRLDQLDWFSVFLWVSPDFLVSVTSLLVHTACIKLNPVNTEEQLLPITEQPTSEPEQPEIDAAKKQRKLSVLVSLGKYVAIMSLFFAGAIRPSGLNAVYFITFLFFMTWWSYNKNLGKPFAYALRVLSGFVAGHIVVIFVYQLIWIKEKLPDRQPLARYFGLRALFNSTCTDPRNVSTTNYEIDTFFHPLILVWLYFVLCMESSLIINIPVVDINEAGMTRQLSTRLSQRSKLLRNQTNRWRSATRKVRVAIEREDDANIRASERTPLIRGRESIYRKMANKRGLVQDATGSVTITDVDESPRGTESPGEADASIQPQGEGESIELDDLTDKDNLSIKKDSGGLVDLAFNAFVSIFQFIAQTSYIATNIIMMTWSITYHSWITFVLLLWASAMWLVPNQRKAMLRSSPFLVFYAVLLLVAQYIYGMDLTEDELPEHIQGFNLRQIGFSKAKHFPIQPLLFKTLFTMMFWITLKQYNQEKWEARNQSALADIAAPLQIGVGTAAGVTGDTTSSTNNVIRTIAQFTRSILTKFWIWVVACILFTIGIVGDRMTIFRIFYMGMALLFILTFQLSWTLWRKIMYGFWLVLIIFSMFILICTYTYQFDNFDAYWEKYLHLPLALQRDMGLEKYETTQLFVKLLTPTFFVIITVIQLYYFHDDFLAISDIKSRNTSFSVRGRQSDSTVPSTGPESSKNSEGHPVQSDIYSRIWATCDLIWLFLEIHLMKLVILSLVLLSVYDVCASHFGFLVMSVVAALFGSRLQTLIAHICSCLISLLIILKMIYQIDYIDHNMWNVTCANTNETYNTAVWLGFEKVDTTHSLPGLLQGYIGVLVVITLHAVVVRRQKFHRVMKGRPPNRPAVMFPRITYKEIDKDSKFFAQYMLNYGFYRFGVEISLISIVALIGLRMDFYATIYALWMFLLISPIRSKLSKIWPLLTVFIVISIPIQYVLAVGLPPTLCIEMPWNSTDILIRLRNWMFLPDNKHPPPVHRVLYDFLVLMFVARQGVMFRLEKRNRNHDFPGGDNSSIIRHIERVGLSNPVPDFISSTRSFLDVAKRVVLTSFYWISLAVFFLAGTNRVNIFSLGYLIGAFIFLWHGNDFYLRPIKSILKWWHYLIIYNIHVIVVKTLLQILGCIFIDVLKKKFCWAVQLLGIACVYQVFPVNPSSPGPVDVIVTNECTVPKDDIGLTWDFFCFAFLILQRRLFNSFYFLRIINEAKAMAILASRGAELIEELSERQVLAQIESENRLLEKIKNKMDRIKASQKKIQQKEGREYKEPTDHFSEKGAEADKSPKGQPKRSRKWAIRSGDYYMFEDYEDDLDLISEKSGDSVGSGFSDEQVDARRTSVSQLISAAMKSDMRRAADEAAAKYEQSKVIARKPQQDDVHLKGDKPGTKSKPVSSDSESEKRKSIKKSPHETPSPPPPSTPSSRGDGKEKEKSKEKEPSKSSSKETSEENVSAKDKIVVLLKFVYEFINSVMVSLTRKLNKTSRDYRYVMKALATEKKLLLNSVNFGVGTRPGKSRVWRPHPKTLASRKDDSDLPPQPEAGPSSAIGGLIEAGDTGSINEIRADDDYRADDFQDIETPSPAVSFGQFEEGELRASDQPPIIRLIIAIWFAVLSHSDLVCFFVIFLHQIFSPSLLSLPLPLMVFLWGTLTVPRPSKRFWVTIIAYTEVVVVIKCMFQFEMLPWNRKVIAENDPFFLPRIIGIERKPGTYAYLDLLLLLVVFFHRAMLKSLGLWKMVPSDTSRMGSFSEPRKALANIYLPDDKHHPDQIVPSHGPTFLDLQHSKLNQFACFRPLLKFFTKLMGAKGRVTTDVYAFMFFCDFINFIVVIFGFSAFGSKQGDGGVSQYFEENKVPVAFLIMLILQFALIIVDRTLYLRKYIFGKLVYQFILVIGIHIWMFLILPAVTQRPFNAATPPQLWYIVKCFYLLLSAYQIRCGYPSRIYGNFLCKGYNYINYYLFKVFMAVPFVFELRALMDWIWTDTSMTLSDWLKMEDIFAHVYQLKCLRRAEREYPQPRGVKKASSSKYLAGGGCLVGIIIVIWFPLVLFALGNTVGKANLPTDVTISVRIGAYAPIYQYTAQNDSIFRITPDQWDYINNIYSTSRGATTFLSNYLFDDVGVVVLSEHSTAVWTISPPDNITFISDLDKDKPIPIRLDWTINRQTSSPEHPPTISESQENVIQPSDPNRQIIVNYLKNAEKTAKVNFPPLFPKFVKITNRGSASAVDTLMDFRDSGENGNVFRSLLGSLHQGDRSMWWELNENCTQDSSNNYLKDFPFMSSSDSCTKLVMYTFSDKAFPATLSLISGKGIIGLYTTFVIVIHSLIRGFFTGISFKIMFDDMPNVDRLLQLCLDIYLVRESGELDLEEDLFAKLVFLYRSPETLIKWTRPPEEIGEDEAEEQPELD